MNKELGNKFHLLIVIFSNSTENMEARTERTYIGNTNTHKYIREIVYKTVKHLFLHLIEFHFNFPKLI